MLCSRGAPMPVTQHIATDTQQCTAFELAACRAEECILGTLSTSAQLLLPGVHTVGTALLCAVTDRRHACSVRGIEPHCCMSSWRLRCWQCLSSLHFTTCSLHSLSLQLSLHRGPV